MEQPALPHPEIEALTEREKVTLRLLLAGHDAKSAARDLGLSVHTINDYLRDARRKLGVTSSREAARQLARAEAGSPQFLGDKPIGVAGPQPDRESRLPPGRSSGRGRSLAWLAGGMLIMSLIVAAVLVPGLVSQGPITAAASQAAYAPDGEAKAAATAAAKAWVALLDGGRWPEAWRVAGAIFRAQMPAERWPAVIAPVRQPLGAAASRTVQVVTAATTLPGVPAGEYQIVQFSTAFAAKPGATETVMLAREAGGWKVDGYFIR